MLLLLGLLPAALAHSAGQTGNSTTGCNCHGATASASTSAAFGSTATTVAPGDVVSLTFAVTSSSATRSWGGLDVSATGGTLGAGSNTQLVAGEITHSAATAMTSGTVTFNLTWTAPSTESTYSLRGAGLAANRNGNDGGDAWNLASTLRITVDDGCDDLDGDGFEACDDGSGADCDDGEAAVYPGAPETCDGVDEDCDGDVDEASAVDAETWYQDADGDGYGLGTRFVVACDLPAGYSADDTDCDDGDAAVHPAATELCDGVDNDCDGSTDPATSADAPTWYLDLDADGHPGATSTRACSAPSGAASAPTDCDDALPGVNPDATETCDGVDQDCDGTVDDAAVDASTWYADGDGDGYGLDSAAVVDCDAPSGHVALAGDCDDADTAFHPGATELCTDTLDHNCDGALAYADGDGDGHAACAECDDGDAAVHPGATETCNGVDDDCDGSVDPATAAGAPTWYADADHDGHGDASLSEVACTAPSGFVADATDCDDADASAYPDAPETCDGADDDCDGTADDEALDASPWYADADADGYGDGAAAVASCSAPAGHVADATDCDDADAAVSPAAAESCDGVDDDCDGTVDEADAADADFWYADADGDGYGDALAATLACAAPDGFVADASDCDDARADVHPGAAELWYDGVDDDCDGNDADADHDGWPHPADCDDADPAVNPDGLDVPYDGVDGDCSGGSDHDADGDGQDSESHGGADCDDADPTTYAGAPELPEDEVENDCDLRNDHDRDDDGYDGEAWGGPDCDDADSTVSPAADDAWYDGVDSDCDGSDDYDQDHDGVAVADDCDDTDRTVAADCGEADTGDTGDTAPADTASPDDDATPDDCAGCAHTPGPATVGALVTLLFAARRRRP